jgi:hypothetical protein
MIINFKVKKLNKHVSPIKKSAGKDYSLEISDQSYISRVCRLRKFGGIDPVVKSAEECGIVSSEFHAKAQMKHKPPKNASVVFYFAPLREIYLQLCEIFGGLFEMYQS